MKEFIVKYKHAVVLLYMFIYMIWFGYLENTVTSGYRPIYTKLDDLIPFNELFIIPYFIWFGYVAIPIVYFLFTSKEDFLRLTAFLFIGMTICLIIYTIYPNGQNLRPTLFKNDNFFVDIVKNLYKVDTSTNVCPSIHVFNSIGIHIGIVSSKLFKNQILIKSGSFILMILICLSTVFLKQHSIIDGICAILLSGIMYVFVYKIKYGIEKDTQVVQDNA